MPDAARKWLNEEHNTCSPRGMNVYVAVAHIRRLLAELRTSGHVIETYKDDLARYAEEIVNLCNQLDEFEADRRNLVAYVRALKVRNGYVHLPFEDMPEAWQALGESLREEINE